MSPKPDASGGSALHLMQVVGARPQFVKLAPVCRAIAAANADGAGLVILTVTADTEATLLVVSFEPKLHG